MESSPGWLNATFLSSVLEGADVISFSTTSVGESGNNYYSRLYRVRVHFRKTKEEKQVVLFIKVPLEQGFVASLKGTEFYSKEPRVYNYLLPKMREKINIDFGPKSFYCPRENTLVLADLKEDGYVMLNKFDQLDFPHCQAVLESLAKFHATSVVLYHENPGLIKSVTEEEAYRSDGHSVTGTPKWLKLCMQRFADIVDEMDVKLSTKELIRNKIENIWEIAINISKPSINSLNVLNHGDCWTNNILFKHNSNGDIISVKFVDFQFFRFASPVLDLITFFYTSANQEVRKNKQQELYTIYLRSLNNTFELLGCKERFTYEDLHRTMRAYSDWIIIVLSFDIPFFLSTSEDAIHFDESTMEDVEAILSDRKCKKLHNSQFYRDLLPDLMKLLENLLYS